MSVKKIKYKNIQLLEQQDEVQNDIQILPLIVIKI